MGCVVGGVERVTCKPPLIKYSKPQLDKLVGHQLAIGRECWTCSVCGEDELLWYGDHVASVTAPS